ncbi:MAG: tetratricopeptide repeat protein [Cyclobacteriaceae bacterium]
MRSTAFFFSFFLFVSQAIANPPMLDSAYYYQRTKHYQQAIRYSEDFIQKDDVTKEGRYNAFNIIAYCHRKSGKPAPALKNYLKALSIYENPYHNARVYYNIGNIYKDYHLYDKAITSYNKALALNTDEELEIKYLISRSIAYKYNNQYHLALEGILMAEKLLANAPENRQSLLYKCYNQRGLIKYETQSYEEAIKYFGYANDLDTRRNAFINIGLCYTELGNDSQAIEAYLSALKTNQNRDQRFKTYQNLGEMYMKLDDRPRAFTYLQQAGNYYDSLLYPEAEDVEIFGLIAAYHKQAGNLGASLAYLEKANKLLNQLDEKKSELLLESEKQELLATEKRFHIDEQYNSSKKLVILCAVLALGILLTGLLITRYFLAKKARIKALHKEEARSIVKKYNLIAD